MRREQETERKIRDQNDRATAEIMLTIAAMQNQTDQAIAELTMVIAENGNGECGNV